MANIAQAIRLALHVGEETLGVKEIFGEDVGAPLGGVFTCTQGLKTAWNAPLDERGIVGMAIGLAMAGQRPVAEIQFCDYIFNTVDLLKIAGNTSWCSNGQFNLPMVIMSPVGAGIHGSIYHSHSFDSMATHIPGLKVILTSNPRDTFGLLIAAIKDPNPVLFLYPKALIRVQTEDEIPGVPADPKVLSQMIDAPPMEQRAAWKPKWPELSAFEIPIGKANICVTGNDLTVVSYGRMLPICVEIAKELQEEGHSVEVIDLRTLYPYDFDAIRASVEKTGRFVVVNEDTEVTNFGEHLIRRVTEDCFYSLEAPPRLIAGANTPGVGLAPALEEAQIPQKTGIKHTFQEILANQA